MTCPVCGTPNAADAVFCFKCGAELKPSAVTGPTVRLHPAGSRTHADQGTEARNVPPAPTPYGTSYGGYAAPQQSSSALIACILGIVSLFLLVLPGSSIVAAIPAVILGRKAQEEIRASRGQLTGEALAQTGIILGWSMIALSVLGFCALCALFAAPFAFFPYIG